MDTSPLSWWIVKGYWSQEVSRSFYSFLSLFPIFFSTQRDATGREDDI